MNNGRKVAMLVLVLVGLLFAVSVPMLMQPVQAPASGGAQTTSAGASGAVGTCTSTPPKVTPPASLYYTIEIDPHTVWRPPGGEVRVTITGKDNDHSPSALAIVTCFARRSWGEGRTFIDAGPITIEQISGNKLVFRTTVPDLTKEDPRYPYNGRPPNWWTRHVIERWDSLINEQSLVPITDLRVIGIRAGAASRTQDAPTTGASGASGAASGSGSAASSQDTSGPVDVLLPIGLTSVSAALLTTVVLILGALLILRRFTRDALGDKVNFLLAVIATKGGVASLSQFQVLLWTFVVGASAIYVILLSGNLIDISTDVLTLLGITGVALLGAQLPNATPATTQRPPGAVAATSAGSSTPDPATQTQTSPPAQNLATAPTPRSPHWSDLIMSLDGSGEIDVSRVQMFFFTLVSALFVLLKVFGNYAIPELPSGYLALMGISNGIYLANKFVPKS